MKTKFYRRFLSALCALVLALGLIPPARAAGTPAASKNVNAHTHTQTTGHPTIKSYLYDNGHGLTRVEFIKPLGQETGPIVVEEYSDAFQLQSSRTIPFELAKWGGFFAGETYNFFIFGQNNTGESDSVETIRVVKYDKSWNRLGHYSLYGGNIYRPFDAATVRCAEYDGYLYIHSGRTMYKLSDGLNHQTNITLQIRESDMTKIQYLDIGSLMSGYVSHSFDQFILVDADRNVVTLDVGDGHPRAIVVIRYDAAKAGPDPLEGKGGYWGGGAGGDWGWHDAPNVSHVWDIPGQTGNNNVRCNMGGFAETSTGYVSAFCRDDDGAGFASRKLYMGYTTKDGLQSSWKLVTPEHTLSAPHLAPTGLNGGWILWNTMAGGSGFYPAGTLQYAPYSADGAVGEIRTAKDAPLSDCAPIQYNGKTVWYTTNDSAPVFYSLDASGVTATPAGGSPAAPGGAQKPAAPAGQLSFTDVSAGHWAYEDIAGAVALGAVSGYPDGSFRPEEEVTYAQFTVMLTQAFLGDLVEEYRRDGTPNAPWYYPYLAAAHKRALEYGTGLVVDWKTWPVVPNVNAPMRRYDAAVMLANYLLNIMHTGFAAGRGEQFTDYNDFVLKYGSSVALCVEKGLMTGMPDGSFSGGKNVTRAQACALINRLYDLANG